MRLLGLGMIAGAVFFGGCQILRERKNRNRRLGELADMLELLRGELSGSAAPLPALLSSLAGRSEGLTKTLLEQICGQMELLGERSFSEIWRECVETCCGAVPCALRVELAGLGRYLGRFPLQEQLSALERSAELLRGCYQQQLREEPVQSRLILGLSAAAAALLVILLL